MILMDIHEFSIGAGNDGIIFMAQKEQILKQLSSQ